MQSKILKSLKSCLEKESEVLLAFVFGSYAKGLETKDSDLDIAVYIGQKGKDSEIAQETVLSKEDEIWSKISDVIRKEIKTPKLPEVSIVCLNKAPASLVSNVFKTGRALVVKDKKLYWELYLKASSEAEDFLSFVEDFWRIKQKAASLSPEEKTRLMLRFDYLKDELRDLERFRNLTQEEYVKDKDKRRNIERWTETIVNAFIDIAKIILASEKKRAPRDYKETLGDFVHLVGLTGEEAEKFSRFAGLRNILAYQYLDILYARLQNFIKEFPSIYQKIYNFLNKYLYSLT